MVTCVFTTVLFFENHLRLGAPHPQSNTPEPATAWKWDHSLVSTGWRQTRKIFCLRHSTFLSRLFTPPLLLQPLFSFDNEPVKVLQARAVDKAKEKLNKLLLVL